MEESLSVISGLEEVRVGMCQTPARVLYQKPSRKELRNLDYIRRKVRESPASLLSLSPASASLKTNLIKSQMANGSFDQSTKVSFSGQEGGEWRGKWRGRQKINRTLGIHQLTRKNFQGIIFCCQDAIKIVGSQEANTRFI